MDIKFQDRLKCLTGLFVLILAGSCHKEKPTPAPPVKVTVEVVSNTNSPQSKSFSGTVFSGSSSTVSFSVPGTILALYATEGQNVKKGQLLGKVKNGDYENASNIAHAELAEARDAYQRLKKLHDANALPDIKWVEIQQKLKQAENAAEIADRTLGDANLYAPVSGIVSRKLADVGQSVLPVEPIYEIVGEDDLTINISLSGSEISGIKNGDPATISFASENSEIYFGKVVSKSVVADPLTRSYKVKVSLPDTEGKVLAGMIGTVTFHEGEIKENNNETDVSIILPSGSVLLDEDNRNFVWLVKDGKASRRFVDADRLVDSGVEVISGLLPGDSVIIEGMQKVGTGTKVETIIK